MFIPPPQSQRSRPSPRQALMITRLIVAAMGMGLLAFSVIAVLVGRSADKPDLAQPLLFALAASCCGSIIAYFVLRPALVRSARHTVEGAASEEERIVPALAAMNNVHIIGGALAEGNGLFGAVIMLISGNWIGLVVAGVALLCILALIPTQSRCEAILSQVLDRDVHL